MQHCITKIWNVILNTVILVIQRLKQVVGLLGIQGKILPQTKYNTPSVNMQYKCVKDKDNSKRKKRGEEGGKEETAIISTLPP